MAIKLPPEKIAELKQRQRELHDILPDIDALQQCGVDCEIPMQQYQLAQDQIAKILEKFGGNATKAT